jgi:isopentenyl-diphosphate delta-isomerase
MKDEETWQGYNEQGEPVGEVTKQAARMSGALHGAAQVWIWKDTDQGLALLLQRRAADKATWPDYLDISAAGHVDYGETVLQAALRETEEEVGLTLTATDLKLLFVYRQNYTDAHSGYIENEFQWVFAYQAIDELDLTFNDHEVSAVEWLGVEEFKRLTTNDLSGKTIVPHDDVYFAMLLTEIGRLRP